MFTLLERMRKLCLLGSISAVLYSIIAIVFWTEAVFNRTWLVQTIMHASTAALTILYFAGMWMVRDASLRCVIGMATVFAVLGFITVPFDSTDVFFYMAQGWQQSNYGVNPYSNVLRDLPNGLSDPMIGTRWMDLNINPWLDEPMPYGFAFALLTWLVAWFGGGNFWLTLAIFELFNLTIHAAITYLLWKTSALLSPVEPKLVLYLYAWSPLVVLQSLANLHNDIVMAALIVLAFYFLLKGRIVWVLPALVVAGFVKYLAFALVPFALIYIVHRYGGWAAARGLALSSVVATGVSLPYIWELRNFRFRDVVIQFTESSGSLHSFIVFTTRAITKLLPGGTFDLAFFSDVSKIVLWFIVGAFCVFMLLRFWTNRKSDLLEVASGWTWILFAIIFIGSSQFYSWYIAIILPLALVGTGKSLLTEIIVVLSGTHLLFTFMRSKAIGYFIITTLIPVLYLIWHNRKSNSVALPFQSPGEKDRRLAGPPPATPRFR